MPCLFWNRPALSAAWGACQGCKLSSDSWLSVPCFVLQALHMLAPSTPSNGPQWRSGLIMTVHTVWASEGGAGGLLYCQWRKALGASVS